MTKIKKIIKLKASKTWYGNLLYTKSRIFLEKLELSVRSDHRYIKDTYRKRFGRPVNLKNPTTYTEKLQWLKLFYRNDKMPICSDKYAVHQYLEHIGYGHLLNKISSVHKNASSIDFESLPKKFVAKTTHGSGQNLICKDKTKLDWENWKRILNSWLKLKVSAFGREWNYANIPPRIIIEKLIDQDPLLDYKFMCFNGEPKFLQINNEKEGEHYVDFYDINWNKVDFTYNKFQQSNTILQKPEKFEEMREIAKKLSTPFPYVRVDFYNPPEKIIFGELTFFPGSGLLPLIPVENGYDEKLGAQIQLPIPNHNLELHKKINQ